MLIIERGVKRVGYIVYCLLMLFLYFGGLVFGKDKCDDF